MSTKREETAVELIEIHQLDYTFCGIAQYGEGACTATAGLQVADKLINTEEANAQSKPKSTTLANGSIVCVWQSEAQDGDQGGIYGQILNQSLVKVGVEFQVNTISTGNQTNPQITSLANGGFSVCWENGAKGGAQTFDSSGVKVGSEFEITALSGVLYRPVVVENQFNDLLFAWYSSIDNFIHTVDRTQTGFAPPLTEISLSLPVNVSRARRPALAANGTKTILTYDGDSTIGSGEDAYLHILNSVGASTSTPVIINSNLSGNDQDARIAVLNGGNYVIVWRGDDTPDAFGIYGQMYNVLDNAVGSNFLINQELGFLQFAPSITKTNSGGFTVAWQSLDQDTDSMGIFAREYNDLSVAEGDEFLVNQTIAGAQFEPSITSTNDKYAIFWYSLDSDDLGIFGRSSFGSQSDAKCFHTFSTCQDKANFSKETKTLTFSKPQSATLKENRVVGGDGSETLINNEETDNQQRVSTAKLDNNNVVAVWQSSLQDSSLYGIYAKIMDSKLDVVVAEFLVNTTTLGDQTLPCITKLNNGGFVIAWQDTASQNIQAQAYNSSGVTAGSEFQVNQNGGLCTNVRADILENGSVIYVWSNSGDKKTHLIVRSETGVALIASEVILTLDPLSAQQIQPDVKTLGSSTLLISFSDQNTDGSSFGIYKQLLSYTATAAVTVGSQVIVNTTTASFQVSSKIARLSNDNYAITWSGNGTGDSSGVFCAMYNSNHTVLKSEFLVNDNVVSDQSGARLTPDDSGGFIVVWSSNLQDSDLSGVFSRRIDSAGDFIDSEYQVNEVVLGAQTLPDLTFVNDVITYFWQGVDSDLTGVFGRYFSDGDIIKSTVYTIPILSNSGHSTTPTSVNIGARSVNSSPLGKFGTLTVNFNDIPHNDNAVDPYAAERSWDALERGTFLTKYLARNPYNNARAYRVYNGFVGQTLDQFEVKKYLIDTISRPNSKGKSTLTGVSPFRRLDERKSQYPTQSSSKLLLDITDTSTTIETDIEVNSANELEENLFSIGSEIIKYTSKVVTAGVKVVYSGCSRGQHGTIAEAHSINDLVQHTIFFDRNKATSSLFNILELLFKSSGFIDADLDLANWQIEISDWLKLYNRLERVIFKPVSTKKLIGELTRECGFFTWYEETESIVKLKAIRPEIGTLPLFTEGNHFLKDQTSPESKTDMRTSEVYVDWNLANATEDATRRQNFKNTNIRLSDGANPLKYGEKSVFNIQARWLYSNSQVSSLTSRALRRYEDDTQMLPFSLDIKDDLKIGDVFEATTSLYVTITGEQEVRQWQVISRHRKNDTIKIIAQEFYLVGNYFVIAPAGLPDYSGATDEQKERYGYLAPLPEGKEYIIF